MSELRRDPLRRRWVVIAPERARRPTLLGDDASDEACPFCEGEELTGRTIARVPGPEGDVRVVANGFPALRLEAAPDPRPVGVYDRLGGFGAHEVVIETSRHDADLPDMAPAQVAAVLLAWRDRVRDLHRDRRMALVTAFRNRGAEAGASIPHPHSQLVATAVIPRRVELELVAADQYQRRHGRCLTCDTLAQERRDGARLVRDDGRFVSFCPYASATPFEICVLPTRHEHDYAALSPADAADLARHLIDVLTRLRRSLEDADYNIALHTAPSEHALPIEGIDAQRLASVWHWRLEILPRLDPGGGFERATDLWVNPTAPEQAAEHLRGLTG
ncbi:MAG: galactose-1-phosphate uridylyltransferase [Deltaproteobacteria bacterium]|nr:galactose-1-phosphate uridylyltransferase [Deltaproteobacteria bacterium]